MPLPAAVEFVFSRSVRTSLPSQRLNVEKMILAEFVWKEKGRECVCTLKAHVWCECMCVNTLTCTLTMLNILILIKVLFGVS